MEEKNGNRILLSIKDLVVKFHVRGRTLTAIRGISLDILENESIAIVGESGSGKSVFTKTFAGMLDSNGFIDQGKIIFDDEELADTKAALNRMGRWLIRFCNRSLDRSARLEAGAETWQKILDLDAELRRAEQLSEEESHELSETIADLRFHMTETFNRRQTLDSRKEKEQIKACTAEINAYKAQIKALEKKRDDVLKAHKKEVLGNRLPQPARRADKGVEARCSRAGSGGNPEQKRRSGKGDLPVGRALRLLQADATDEGTAPRHETVHAHGCGPRQ